MSRQRDEVCELPMVSVRIKTLRKKAGVTQVQLASALGVSKGTIAMWEVGARHPRTADVYKMAQFFHCRMDYILGYSIDDGYYDYEMEYLL